MYHSKTKGAHLEALFSDILRLSPDSLRNVLLGIDNVHMVVFVRFIANDAVVSHICSALSKRGAWQMLSDSARLTRDSFLESDFDIVIARFSEEVEKYKKQKIA